MKTKSRLQGVCFLSIVFWGLSSYAYAEKPIVPKEQADAICLGIWKESSASKTCTDTTVTRAPDNSYACTLVTTCTGQGKEVMPGDFGVYVYIKTDKTKGTYEFLKLDLKNAINCDGKVKVGERGSTPSC